MQKNKNPLAYLTKMFWRYSRGNRKNVVLYSLMLIISECINTFWIPLVWMWIIQVVTSEGINDSNISKLFLLLGTVLLGTTASWGFHGPARVMEQVNAFLVKANYREFLLQGVMNMPLAWHVDHHSGDTIDRIGKGAGGLSDYSENIFQILKPAVQLLGSLGMIFYFSPASAGIVLPMIAISAWITVRFDRVLSSQYRSLNKSENHVSESIFDAVSNITTVIILRVEKLVFTAIMHKIMGPLDLLRSNVKANELKWALTSHCNCLMMILVLSLYFYQNRGANAGVLVSSVYLLLNYLDRVGNLFYEFTSLYGWVIRQKFKVINSEELASDFTEVTFANHVLPSTWSKLEIQNLSFSYHKDGEADLHLRNVFLALHRGERVAFVGESGSGKTTLLKIIRDLHPPQQGTLLVDGKKVSEGFGGISRAIALVPQNPEIFATTIRENITLGAEHDQWLIRVFTDMACFSEVIATLPKGLDSSIKEKGVNLSGGQSQRLALARGFLACHDKDIILLDEPTSSLDTATEMRVYQNVFEGFRGKTVISSVHRLHLLPLFDRICMFSGGRIVATGSLSELLATSPEFQRLWRYYQDAV